MADKYVNAVGVQTIKTWAEGKFALDNDLDTLSARVDEIVSEGGEPNAIQTISVNGTNVAPDAQKNVDIDVPSLSIEDRVLTLRTGDYEARIEYLPLAKCVTFGTQRDGSSPIFTDLPTKEYVDRHEGKIDTISVNGTTQTIDSNKNVNLTVPTKTSDLTNDGDGTAGSAFATQAYVATNGGKIDKIKVNNTEQTITNKEVNITVPTQVSDLTNDSGFQTASDVSTAISQAVASAYIYKGSVATVDALPTSGNTVGDVYDVQSTGVNYAWTGTTWDALGAYVDTSVLWTSTAGQSNTLEAMTVAEVNAILNAE